MKSKPLNMKYTDLCIYIDKTVYNRDKNNNPISLRMLTDNERTTIYNYLYNTVIALAIKGKIMTKKEDYVDFATYASSRLYFRLTNQKQFEYNEKNKKRAKPIKSILNYIKNSLYFLAVDFRNEYFDQIVNPEFNEEDALSAREYLQQSVLDSYEPIIRQDIDNLLTNSGNLLSLIVNKGRFNEIEKLNLKMSIMLSLLNAMTLPSSAKIQSYGKRLAFLTKQLENKDNYIIQWGSIPKQQIQLYMKKFLISISNETETTKQGDLPNDDIIDAILASSLPTYGTDQTNGE